MMIQIKMEFEGFIENFKHYSIYAMLGILVENSVRVSNDGRQILFRYIDMPVDEDDDIFRKYTYKEIDIQINTAEYLGTIGVTRQPYYIQYTDIDDNELSKEEIRKALLHTLTIIEEQIDFKLMENNPITIVRKKLSQKANNKQFDSLCILLKKAEINDIM